MDVQQKDSSPVVQQFLCNTPVLHPYPQRGASVPCRRDFPTTITCSILVMLVIQVLFPQAQRSTEAPLQMGKCDNLIKRKQSPLTQLLPGLSQKTSAPGVEHDTYEHQPTTLKHLTDWEGISCRNTGLVRGCRSRAPWGCTKPSWVFSAGEEEAGKGRDHSGLGGDKSEWLHVIRLLVSTLIWPCQALISVERSLNSISLFLGEGLCSVWMVGAVRAPEQSSWSGISNQRAMCLGCCSQRDLGVQATNQGHHGAWGMAKWMTTLCVCVRSQLWDSLRVKVQVLEGVPLCICVSLHMYFPLMDLYPDQPESGAWWGCLCTSVLFMVMNAEFVLICVAAHVYRDVCTRLTCCRCVFFHMPVRNRCSV